MKLSEEKERNIVIVHLGGEISEDTYEALDARITTLKAAGAANIALDLGKVSHIHYKVIARLLERKGELARLGGDIKLINVNPYLYDIFRLYGFYPFEIYPSRRAVIKSFAATTA